jgi:soluble lytic murein transglycosylase-like protein/thioredoxin-like negative regulator of GroEL
MPDASRRNVRRPAPFAGTAAVLLALSSAACQLPAREEGHRHDDPDAAAPVRDVASPSAADALPSPAAGDDAGAGASGDVGGEEDGPSLELPTLVVELGPALTGRPASEAAEAFAAGDFAEAARLYEQVAAAAERDGSAWYEASLMAGLAWLEAGRGEEAAERLRGLADHEHPLTPFVRLSRARADLQRDEPERTLAELEGSWEPPYADEAARLRAEALVAAGKPADAAATLETAGIARTDSAIRLLYDRARLEDRRLAGGAPEGAALELCRDALADLRALRAERPGTTEGDEADRLLRAYAGLLPRRERSALLDLTLADRIERVRRLTSAYRYDTAQEEAEKLLDGLSADDPLRCSAFQAAADAWYRARDYARAAQRLDDTLAACAGTDAWPQTAYRTARTRLNLDDRAGAAELFESLERVAPHDPLVPDARLARAEIALEEGNGEAFESLAKSVVEDFRGTDRADEATWMLGWQALAADRPADAERSFAALVADGWASPEPSQGGRARYWHGVALARAGREEEASTEWGHVLSRDPLTFYGLLAYGRLRLADETNARGLLGEALARRPEARPPRVAIPDVPLTRSDGFRRAVAFLRLGLWDQADAEIAVLRAGPGVPDQAAAALATLAQRVGAYRLGRRLGGVSRWPLGIQPLDAASLRDWELAYPRGFENTVTKAAEAQQLPASFLFGVIHEESGFETRAFSSAHAVGLMQLLVGTAERFAPPAGIEGRVTRQRLGRPSVNVPIGAAFLRFLADRYPERMVLLPAAYNAGENRLDRWLAAKGDLPLDEFVEAIPFDQTRTYLMRVISSWAIYQALYAPPGATELLPVVDPTVRARP